MMAAPVGRRLLGKIVYKLGRTATLNLPRNNFFGVELLSVRSLRLAAALYDALQIRMPSLSPTMMKGTIVKWHKKEGDSVAAGEMICDIQTDKAVVGMDVDDDGILAKILVPDNSADVKIGTLIALIVEPGADWKGVTVPVDTAPAGAVKIPAVSIPTPVSTATAHTTSSHRRSAHDTYGPAVRAILETYNIKPGDVKATGPHDRLLKGDLLRLIKEKNLKPVAIKAHAILTDVTKPAAAISKPQRAAVATVGAYTDIPCTTMRSVIAKRLTLSKTTIPHSYAAIDCRVDSLLKLRKELIAAGVKVGVNDFIIKAAAVALQTVPKVNAIWANDSARLLRSVDISIAVATDNGLITPIVKGALELGVEEISLRVKDLAARARAGKLKPDEFQGGSFTISNLGMFGISSFSAVINPPQACILAIGGSRSVLVEDPETGPRPQTVLSVTSSSDARIIDDLLAVEFLAAFCNVMENPALMLSHGRPATNSHVQAPDVQKLFAK